MKRGARSFLAVAVGFAGGTAVFQAAGLEPLGRSSPVVLGVVDVDDYCRDVHGPDSNAMLAGSNAYSWRCSTRQNEIFRLVEVDFDVMCTDRFGDDARPNNWDEGDPYAWECVKR